MSGRSYVLVHGAWHGGWCWSRVAGRLRAAGHQVYTPTLTGLGERSHLSGPHVNLTTHVTDVASVFRWEDLHDVVLCGHSYGGFVISGVAEEVGERIRALIFLDAFVPEDGQAMIDALAEQQRERTRGQAASGSIPPIPAEYFRVNAADRAYVDRLCVPQPPATFTEPLRLTGARERVPQRVFIRAADYPAEHFERARARSVAAGWTVHDVHAGHDVMLDAPAELSAILLDYA